MIYSESFSDPAQSFWEEFPKFKLTPPFKKLFKEDRSKDKNKSSKCMWYCALTCDLDSEFYSMGEDEQIEVMKEVLEFDAHSFLGAEGLDDLKSGFENFTDTVILADIRAQERKLVERKKFIKETPYTLDEVIVPESVRMDAEGNEYTVYGKPYSRKGTAAQLDKMVTDTKKIHDEIRQLREAAKNDKSGSGEGGRESSFLERG